MTLYSAFVFLEFFVVLFSAFVTEICSEDNHIAFYIISIVPIILFTWIESFIFLSEWLSNVVYSDRPTLRQKE